jgi:hypothetical protein
MKRAWPARLASETELADTSRKDPYRVWQAPIESPASYTVDDTYAAEPWEIVVFRLHRYWIVWNGMVRKLNLVEQMTSR